MAEGFDAYTAFQTVTDWRAVRNAGKTFAYFKGTDGMSTRDTADWPARARSVGIACGLYGYAQPGTAADQYDLLLRTAQARGAMDLSPALDLENPFVPGSAAAQFAIAWLSRAAAAGQIPVFYANDSMMGYILPAVRAAVPGVWPWIARYGAPPKNGYRTWQFSSTRPVPGIRSSGVDEDTGDVPATGGVPAPTPGPAAAGEDEEMDRVDFPAIASGGRTRLRLGGTDQARTTFYPSDQGFWVENIFFWGEGHVDGDNQTGGLGQQTNPVYSNGGKPRFFKGVTTFTCPKALIADIEFSCAGPLTIIARG